MEKNFSIHQVSHAVRHKAYGHAFGAVQAVLCEEILRSYTGKIVTFLGVYFTRVGFAFLAE